MGIAERRAMKGMWDVNDVYATAAFAREEKEAGKKGKGKIKQCSEDRSFDNKVLKFLYDIFLEKRTVCRIQSPDCTKMATVVHHKKGRGRFVLFDWSTWLPCCPACNGYVEANHEWAKSKGFMVSKLAKK